MLISDEDIIIYVSILWVMPAVTYTDDVVSYRVFAATDGAQLQLPL